MPTKESLARSKVHNLLPKRQFSGPFWYQSMSGTGTGGTPDHFYDGPTRTLWVEWKWTESKNPRTLPDCTDLQETWLLRRHRNGGQVAVIEGCPVGFRIYNGDSWYEGEVHLVSSKAEVAEYIKDKTHEP